MEEEDKELTDQEKVIIWSKLNFIVIEIRERIPALKEIVPVTLSWQKLENSLRTLVAIGNGKRYKNSSLDNVGLCKLAFLLTSELLEQRCPLLTRFTKLLTSPDKVFDILHHMLDKVCERKRKPPPPEEEKSPKKHKTTNEDIDFPLKDNADANSEEVVDMTTSSETTNDFVCARNTSNNIHERPQERQQSSSSASDSPLNESVRDVAVQSKSLLDRSVTTKSVNVLNGPKKNAKSKITDCTTCSAKLPQNNCVNYTSTLNSSDEEETSITSSHLCSKGENHHNFSGKGEKKQSANQQDNFPIASSSTNGNEELFELERLSQIHCDRFCLEEEESSKEKAIQSEKLVTTKRLEGDILAKIVRACDIAEVQNPSPVSNMKKKSNANRESNDFMSDSDSLISGSNRPAIRQKPTDKSEMFVNKSETRDLTTNKNIENGTCPDLKQDRFQRWENKTLDGENNGNSCSQERCNPSETVHNSFCGNVQDTETQELMCCWKKCCSKVDSKAVRKRSTHSKSLVTDFVCENVSVKRCNFQKTETKRGNKGCARIYTLPGITGKPVRISKTCFMKVVGVNSEFINKALKEKSKLVLDSCTTERDMQKEENQVMTTKPTGDRQNIKEVAPQGRGKSKTEGSNQDSNESNVSKCENVERESELPIQTVVMGFPASAGGVHNEIYDICESASTDVNKAFPKIQTVTNQHQHTPSMEGQQGKSDLTHRDSCPTSSPANVSYLTLDNPLLLKSNPDHPYSFTLGNAHTLQYGSQSVETNILTLNTNSIFGISQIGLSSTEHHQSTEGRATVILQPEILSATDVTEHLQMPPSQQGVVGYATTRQMPRETVNTTMALQPILPQFQARPVSQIADPVLGDSGVGSSLSDHGSPRSQLLAPGKNFQIKPADSTSPCTMAADSLHAEGNTCVSTEQVDATTPKTGEPSDFKIQGDTESPPPNHMENVTEGKPLVRFTGTTITISGGTVEKDWLKALFIPDRNNILKFVVDHSNCSLAIDELSGQISTLSSLKVLKLVCTQIDENLPFLMYEVARKCQKLHTLSFNGNNVYERSLPALHDSLKGSPSLRQLNAGDCDECTATEFKTINPVLQMICSMREAKVSYGVAMQYHGHHIYVKRDEKVQVESEYWSKDLDESDWKALLGTLGLHVTELKSLQLPEKMEASLFPLVTGLIQTLAFIKKIDLGFSDIDPLQMESFSKTLRQKERFFDKVCIRKFDNYYEEFILVIVIQKVTRDNHGDDSNNCLSDAEEEDKPTGNDKTGSEGEEPTEDGDEDSHTCSSVEDSRNDSVPHDRLLHMAVTWSNGEQYLMETDIVDIDLSLNWLREGDTITSINCDYDLMKLYVLQKHSSQLSPNQRAECEKLASLKELEADSLDERIVAKMFVKAHLCCTDIAKIAVNQINMGENGRVVRNAIIKQDSLISLHLIACDFDYNDMQKVTDGLARQAGTLEVVDLGMNNVGDTTDLGRALARHNKLRELHLDYCSMEADEVRALAAGLAQQAGTLEVVDLSGNEVGDTAGDLGQALARHNKLRKLHLNCCSMGADHVRALAASLTQQAGTLESVNLARNKVGDAAGDLGQALARHNKLRELNLSDCSVEADDVRPLAAGLAQQAGSLEVVDLSGNEVGDAAGDLAQSIKHHTALRRLSLLCSGLNSDQREAIKQLLPGVSLY